MNIPEDVMKTARSVYMDLMTTCERWCEEDAAEDIPAIARAILAERERCAKVVEADVPKDCAYGPGKGIAAAIRRGDA